MPFDAPDDFRGSFRYRLLQVCGQVGISLTHPMPDLITRQTHMRPYEIMSTKRRIEKTPSATEADHNMTCLTTLPIQQ